MSDPPFYINAAWFQEGIANSNNSKRLVKINEFWKLDQIKKQVESSPQGSWESTYICAMALISEAVRTITIEYGFSISAAGYDSDVYLEHFKNINAINPLDYGVIT
ncbi:hypothetical protein D9M69_687470 [compost metagenome]